MGEKCCEDIVCEGCWTLLWLDPRRKYLFKVRRGFIQGSDKGVLRHDDIIGLRYGSVVELSSGYKAFILKPLLIDFLERGLTRKSQVIYPKDQGLMTILLGLAPGARVVEIGVGSAFTTIVLANIIGSEGKVYAYEVRSDMLEVARRNLESMGLLDRVVLHRKDAREGIEEEGVDAIVVDIPDPWSIINHACATLKPGRPIVFFVPSINQVERLLKALETSCLIDVRVYEVLLREYTTEPDSLRPLTRMIGHTGYIVFARSIGFPKPS